MPIGYTLLPIMAGVSTTQTVEESGRAFGEKILAGIEPALTDDEYLRHRSGGNQPTKT
jgi:hypothetical protein